MSSQITTLVAYFGLSKLLKRFDLTTPEAILYIRIMYYASQVLQLLLCFYIRHLIQKKGKKEERVTMIEVVEPAKPFSSEPPKKTRISIHDYDLADIQKRMSQIITGMLITSVMHFWFKLIPPLVIQAIIPWINFFSAPIVQIRLFGWKAEGNLARPWKVPNPFGDLLGQMANTDNQGKKDDDVSAGAILDKKGSESESESEAEAEADNKSETSVNSETSEPEVKASGVKSRKSRKEE